MDIKIEHIIGINTIEHKDYVAYEIFYQTEWDKKNNVISRIIIHRDKEKLKEIEL